ncbi:MAG: hypothetical protein LC126_07570 [Bryobacterales bacterium]|nr:hypothetical protein [Bryobacterales bacterium]
MKVQILAGLALSLLFTVSCAKKEVASGTGPRATVLLRDGTKLSGTVTNSSASGMTLVSGDNVSHALDMKDVKSVEYGEAPPPAGQAQTPIPSETASPMARTPAPTATPRSRPESRPAESAPRVTVKTYELPAGTEISIRTGETIDSRKTSEGQTYAAEVTQNIADASGAVVIPRGSDAKIIIRSASKGGRITGASDLVLDLESVTVNGKAYRVDTSDIQQKGKSGLGGNKRTAEYVGGGAAIGAIIGAIAGHGKGAAIGAASGAAAGAAGQLITRGKAIQIPAESVLTFRLDAPLHVSEGRP